jgi:hypothetical protein
MSAATWKEQIWSAGTMRHLGFSPKSRLDSPSKHTHPVNPISSRTPLNFDIIADRRCPAHVRLPTPYNNTTYYWLTVGLTIAALKPPTLQPVIAATTFASSPARCSVICKAGCNGQQQWDDDRVVDARRSSTLSLTMVVRGLGRRRTRIGICKLLLFCLTPTILRTT